MDRLFESGYFAEVNPSAEDTRDGLKIIYSVRGGGRVTPGQVSTCRATSGYVRPCQVWSNLNILCTTGVMVQVLLTLPQAHPHTDDPPQRPTVIPDADDDGGGGGGGGA